jgi:uncharacterized membrane protein YphA (DoxX/SURF4 family)
LTADFAMPEVARLLVSQLAAFLALLLAASAVHKWMRRKHTQDVVHEFAGVPRPAAAWAVVAVALCELSAAALLIVPAYRLPGALLATLILGAYLALIARAIVQGRRDVDCGCSFSQTRHPLGAFEVVRNSLLVIFALLVAVTAPGGGVPMPASQVLAGCTFLALYGALDQVRAVRPLRRGEAL